MESGFADVREQPGNSGAGDSAYALTAMMGMRVASDRHQTVAERDGAVQGDWLLGDELARVIRQDRYASPDASTEDDFASTDNAVASTTRPEATSGCSAGSNADSRQFVHSSAPSQGRNPAAVGFPGSNDAPGSDTPRALIASESPGVIIDTLAQAPASGAAAALTEAEAASPAALARLREEAQKALPEIPTPTGIQARRTDKADNNGSFPGASAQPIGVSIQPVQSDRAAEATNVDLVEEAPAAPEPAPTQLAGSEGDKDEQGRPKNDPALARSAQSALASVSASAEQVPTQATGAPNVDMTGEADPGQLQSAFNASEQQTRQAASTATRETGQDFGEGGIFPEPDEEVLRASHTLGEPKLPKGGSRSAAALPAEAMAAIDAEASPVLHQRIGAEKQKYTRGEAQYDADSQAAHHKARQDISSLEQDTRATQEEAQQGARADVALARQDWQGEIEKVQTDFKTTASQAHGEHFRQIQAKELEGNQRASEHIAKAERQAEEEKSKARSEVESKKRAAKKESKGFWGWAKSKAKALVNGLKKAVNVIYDGLRKAVNVLFEAAKKLALATIELARKAIVGLIAAYGAVLKGLVSMALAAFPKIRDKIKQRIDQVVSKATEVVNKAASALKQGVTAIIDFLASTIDKALGLIQDLYNGIFTVIAMIISGELQELLARLGNLIDAARTAPGQFETAAYEELLDGNLDQPLSPAELIAAGRTPPGGAITELEETDGIDAESMAAASEGAMPRPPWTDSNVGVDEVATGEKLSPELTEQLLQMIGGGDGEVTFGESQDSSRSLDVLLAGHGQRPGQGTAGVWPSTGQQVAAAPMSHDDGLTPRERAAIKWQAMRNGLANWWSENWPQVLAGGVLGVAGFIVANILTGGAILAALPAFMTAIGYIFSGVMVAQLASHLRDYLQKGWNGDIQGGGKSLAKGLAAGAIELISLLTFKVGSVAMKGAKAAAKGGRALARGATHVARRGAGYVVNGGKVLLRGAGRGITTGAKRLRELGARLLGRTRFKGFRIRIRNRRFRLEGRINPWILLSEGSTIKVDTDELPALARQGDELVTRHGRAQVLSMTDELPSERLMALIDRHPLRQTFDQPVGKLDGQIEYLAKQLDGASEADRVRLQSEIKDLAARKRNQRVSKTYEKRGRKRERGVEDTPRTPAEDPAAIGQQRYDELVEDWRNYHQTAADRRVAGMKGHAQGTELGIGNATSTIWRTEGAAPSP